MQQQQEEVEAEGEERAERPQLVGMGTDMAVVGTRHTGEMAVAAAKAAWPSNRPRSSKKYQVRVAGAVVVQALSTAAAVENTRRASYVCLYLLSLIHI